MCSTLSMRSQRSLECRLHTIGLQSKTETCTLSLITNITWSAKHKLEILVYSVTNRKAHSSLIFPFNCPTLRITNNSGHLECISMDFDAFPQCSWTSSTEKRSSFLLKSVHFSPGEVIPDWMNWLMSQIVTDDSWINLLRLDFQVLWHIPEISVALVDQE